MAAVGGITQARWAALATGNGGLPTSAEWPAVAAALVVIALVGLLALRALGLTWLESALVALLAPATVLVDVPVAQGSNGVLVLVNVAGCALPVAVSLAIVATRALAPVVTLVLLGSGVALAVTFSWVVPERGVLLDYRACALSVGLVAAALLHGSPRRAGALAFAAAAIGTTLGADLLRLGALMRTDAVAITLGGAGLLDGILLTSLLAALVAAGSAAGVHAVLRAASRPPAPARG